MGPDTCAYVQFFSFRCSVTPLLWLAGHGACDKMEDTLGELGKVELQSYSFEPAMISYLPPHHFQDKSGTSADGHLGGLFTVLATNGANQSVPEAWSAEHYLDSRLRRTWAFVWYALFSGCGFGRGSICHYLGA